MSWLGRLIDWIAPLGDADYDAALAAKYEGDKAALEEVLRRKPALVRGSASLSGSLLHNAALQGQIEIAEMLIARGAAVNDASTRDKEAPIHWAAEAGHLDMVRLLVEHGADANALSCSRTPLEWAVWADAGARKDVIRHLVAVGAKHSAIHVAAALGDTGTAEKALGEGADVDAKDASGRTPLHWATASGDTAQSMVEFLLNRGADVEGKTPAESPTPLYLASAAGNQSALETLIGRGANVNAPGPFGGTPLLVAQSQGHGAAARLLLEHGADASATSDFRSTAVHAATSENDVELLNQLLDKGSDPNAMTPLVAARAPGGQRIWRFTPRNMVTPLHIAAQEGYLDAAEALLRHGADVNKPDMEGRSPLHIAALTPMPEMARLLLSHGADSSLKDKKGKTPSGLAAEAGHGDTAALLSDRDGG